MNALPAVRSCAEGYFCVDAAAARAPWRSACPRFAWSRSSVAAVDGFVGRRGSRITRHCATAPEPEWLAAAGASKRRGRCAWILDSGPLALQGNVPVLALGALDTFRPQRL